MTSYAITIASSENWSNPRPPSLPYYLIDFESICWIAPFHVYLPNFQKNFLSSLALNLSESHSCCSSSVFVGCGDLQAQSSQLGLVRVQSRSRRQLKAKVRQNRQEEALNLYSEGGPYGEREVVLR